MFIVLGMYNFKFALPGMQLSWQEMQKWWETYYCFIILKTLTKHVLFDKHSIENYKIGAKST